jgi:sugar phosphate isomerase/epimerase
MKRSLALHHFTLFDLTPEELVPIAAAAGCDGVCIFVESPEDPTPGQDVGKPRFPVLARNSGQAFKSLCRDHGVHVRNLEFFPLGPEPDFEQYRSSLAFGAELGGRLAVTHLHDPDDNRAIGHLSQLAEIAAEFDLAVGLEFMGLSPACATLQRARYFVQQAGYDNLGIGVDFLHAHLTGAVPADLPGIPAEDIAYAQCCDIATPYSPDIASSIGRSMPLAFERLVPGAGVIPVQAFVDALPDTVPIDVEVPSPGYKERGLSALDHARAAVEASMKLFQ